MSCLVSWPGCRRGCPFRPMVMVGVEPSPGARAGWEGAEVTVGLVSCSSVARVPWEEEAISPAPALHLMPTHLCARQSVNWAWHDVVGDTVRLA